MTNKYYEKILKQLTVIKVSLILSILLFTLINYNKLLVLILFSLLTATSLYRLIAIKLYLIELLQNQNNNNNKEIEVKEQELINCYNELTLKEKDYFANETKENDIQEEKEESQEEKVQENIADKEYALTEGNKEIEEDTTKEIKEDIKETEEVREEAIKEVKEVLIEPTITNKNKEKHLLTNSFVYTMEEQQLEEDANENEDNIKNDNKKKKKAEKKVEKTEKIDISKCIRKLPKGRKASESAIKLAKEYGYELKEGETFVKPRSK